MKTFEEKCTAADLCPQCGGELDTGWECNKCGYDAKPHTAPARCAAVNRNAGYVSCVKPSGHLSNHEDSFGCWWR